MKVERIIRSERKADILGCRDKKKVVVLVNAIDRIRVTSLE